VGLIELAANGKAHLIPIVIMWDGKFYDASAYKASPVPIALESETVYEAVRTGVSQGLFTVSGALHAKNNTWIGDGKWQSAAEIAAAEAKKKPAAMAKPQEEDPNAPPVLRRRDSEKPKPSESGPSQSAPSQSAPQTSSAAPPGAPTSPPAPASAPAASPAASLGTQASSPSAPDPVENDPNRPTLRHGKPAVRARDLKPTASVAMPGKPAVHPPGTATAPSPGSASVQLIPAISDASGPEPRPYAYSMKTEEEQKFRTKMLAFAADEVRARAAQLASGPVGSAVPSHSSPHQGKIPAAKLLQPSFDDVQLRVFDLSNSNEPVLVLTTKARLPQRPNAAGPSLEYYVTLVVRSDIYGELHKAFANVTDNQHLDALPRFELIDAVDVDGDGRGELLFRQSSDAGTAFVVYRVIGDQLWPLFQGTPVA